ncbi:alpha/beta fold hydrolase [Planomicrobium sp. CPCC 101079]|uniref:alpha/beta fold hydrolase n=1 Tax=Planomicrobium sp. CPCC 101079 TaxID=2599618 RepID=UPI0011B7180C|nr:alpha/beta hydrolase [Planomicrobium sp. CPCC 101079]TWT00137.1 alpha/beta hydrolase [Planomicrobium sp. CPCC 101079]
MNKQIEEQSIDIGGVQLYYEDVGKSSGNPTVVFDSGYGWTTEKWNSVKNEVSAFSRMIIYDRSGLGRSSYDGRPRHSQQNVENLRALLQKAEVKPPYVLVGHSFGGVNVRLYASTYPDEIAGLILLDSCHEDQNRLIAPLFSPQIRAEYFGQFIVEGTLAEFEESLEQVRKHKSLGNVSLTVITGGKQPHHTVESWAYWMEFQKNLAQLSSHSRHIILEEAGHGLHLDCPEAVIEQIRTMVESLKGKVNRHV